MRKLTFIFVVIGALTACNMGTPPEPGDIQQDPAAAKNSIGGLRVATAIPVDAPQAAPQGAGMGGAGGGGAAPASDDPLHGSFSLSEATKDLHGTGPLVAKIDTSMGTLQCKLYDDKAPVTVANFIGLATGKRTWKDPSRNWVNRPAYDGTTFHRIIKGFMIQGGDSKGNGTGEPGYVIKDEIWDGARHDRAGLLCMANRGPNTNGAQFFITDAAAAHLDRGYTIFGECAPEQVVHDIANVPVTHEKPQTPVTIRTITIARQKPATGNWRRWRARE